MELNLHTSSERFVSGSVKSALCTSEKYEALCGVFALYCVFYGTKLQLKDSVT